MNVITMCVVHPQCLNVVSLTHQTAYIDYVANENCK